ncbi:hypothetical protein GCM10028781_21020 [Nostocoides australiense]
MNKEIQRRSRVVGIFPNPAASTRSPSGTRTAAPPGTSSCPSTRLPPQPLRDSITVHVEKRTVAGGAGDDRSIEVGPSQRDRVDELPSIRVTQEVDRASSGALVPRTLPYGFKTLKYAPGFPERFGSLADARAFGERFLRLLQP